MNKFIIVIIFILVLIWEKWRRPIVCGRKIYEHIKEQGGEIISVERMSSREEIYHVHYKIRDKDFNSVVKFNIFYHSYWK